MVSVQVRSLSKSFGDTVALQSINLRIEPGEMFFLLGASGCGKTTLLRHIAGFYQPDQGHIFFDQQEVTKLAPHRRNCAMMFQSYALWPHLSVAENVAFGLEERKIAPQEIKDRVLEALMTVKMEEYAHRRINQLSGGQQQRVALARAMTVRPHCLLLDEPLSNLDTKLRNEMRSEIRRICKKHGLTAIYVTHDQKEALSMGDRMAIMDKGVVAQVGTPQEIYRQPKTLSVAQFIGETNAISGEILNETSRPGVWSVSTAHGTWWGRVSDPGYRPQSGDMVKLAIRPESMSFVTEVLRTNILSGKLHDAIYLGDVAQYVLQDVKGHLYRLSEANPQGLRDDLPSQLQFTANPWDTMILRR